MDLGLSAPWGAEVHVPPVPALPAGALTLPANQDCLLAAAMAAARAGPSPTAVSGLCLDEEDLLGAAAAGGVAPRAAAVGLSPLHLAAPIFDAAWGTRPQLAVPAGTPTAAAVHPVVALHQPIPDMAAGCVAPPPFLPSPHGGMGAGVDAPTATAPEVFSGFSLGGNLWGNEP